MSSSARIDELRRKFDENPRRYFAPLANEYRKVGDFDQAIFICQEYLPQQPGHMSGHIVFGQALFEAKRFPEARTVFETALTLDPENLIALRHLADISRDLGETTAARVWYERVLQADPRNEEIAAIMSAMPDAGSPPAKTVEAPVVSSAPAAAPPNPPPAAAAAAAAPTVELSAAAVQEMIRARQATQQHEVTAHEKLSLDQTPTVEVDAGQGSSTLEGFETTSHEGPLDIPSGGMLGLEPTSAASESLAAPTPISSPEGLDSLTLDDFSVPTAGAPVPPPAPAPAEPSGGLLDLDSFELGGGSPAATQEPAAPSLLAPAMDFAMPAAEASAPAPIDQGEIPVADFDFDVPVTPSAPPAPPRSQESVPTMVMDVIEDAIPAVIDIVDDAVPAVVDAIVGAPTMIMDAIGIDLPLAEAPAVVAKETPKSAPTVAKESETLAPTQQMDVAKVMEQVAASHQAKAAAEAPAERQAAPFATETMAQLYLGQGHRAEAIEIYRQLVAARPNDAELRGRLDAIERGSGSVAPQAMEAPTASAPPAPVAMPATRIFAVSGPTIRTVLRDLFGIDSQSTNGSTEGNGAGDGELGSIDILFSAQSVPDTLSPLAAAFDGGYVAPSGSIDAVFATDQR